VLPDADEPVVHVYAEGRLEEDSASMLGELRDLVEEIVQQEAVATP
jgi:phosphomannomutase